MKKVIIAIPCFDKIDVEFVQSLLHIKPVGQTKINFAVNSLVYASREKLADEAIQAEADYVLWLDSDMTFAEDTLRKLIADEKDIVSGLCFARRPPYNPTIYDSITIGIEGKQARAYLDYPENAVFEIEACGSACMLTSVRALKQIREAEGALFQPLAGFGEDLSFCIRAKRQGYTMFCDSSVKTGHKSTAFITEHTFKNYGGLSNE